MRRLFVGAALKKGNRYRVSITVHPDCHVLGPVRYRTKAPVRRSDQHFPAKGNRGDIRGDDIGMGVRRKSAGEYRRTDQYQLKKVRSMPRAFSYTTLRAAFRRLSVGFSMVCGAVKHLQWRARRGHVSVHQRRRRGQRRGLTCGQRRCLTGPRHRPRLSGSPVYGLVQNYRHARSGVNNFPERTYV